jgi:hypothetical protein
LPAAADTPEAKTAAQGQVVRKLNVAKAPKAEIAAAVALLKVRHAPRRAVAPPAAV